jgi:hypothetical protein
MSSRRLTHEAGALTLCVEFSLFAMKNNRPESDDGQWPERPKEFPQLMTPVEAAMFLRLDQTGHNPASGCRTLNYWRDHGELRATKFARRVWYLKEELEKFLQNKTEA